MSDRKISDREKTESLRANLLHVSSNALEYADIPTALKTLKPDHPLYALRLSEVRRRAEDFSRQFPGDVLYAVKANPQLEVLRALYAGGIRHFDVASLTEMRLIKQHFPDALAYFMHPVKSVTAIREAIHEHGISHFVVDHADELAKVIIHTLSNQTNRPKPTILIRLAMPRNRAVYDLGGKFGCSTFEAVALARAAAAQGLAVGFSFHVGSQCLDPSAYRDALSIVGNVVRTANIHPDLIDIGGGFPVAYRNTPHIPLTSFINVISEGVKAIGLQHPTRLLAEPGRALVASGASLVVKVELRRDQNLYLNDGMYGGISELRFAGLDVPLRVWRTRGDCLPVTSAMSGFRFYGPTCDSADFIEGPFILPDDIRMGDYIEIGQMGAYSLSMRSDFNGFQEASLVNVKDVPFLP